MMNKFLFSYIYRVTFFKLICTCCNNTGMRYSDEEIIDSIIIGKDREILMHLYKDVLPKVKAYICKNQGTDDEAFDIFQDAIVAFYKYVKENKFKKEHNVSTFIFCICRNLWINKAKRDKKSISIEAGFDQYKDESENALDGIITSERASLIQQVLSELGKKCEELLKYSIYDDLSLKEICKIMGFTSEDAVKTRKYKCKQKLIELLKNKRELNFLN